jgi:hypothetical protein
MLPFISDHLAPGLDHDQTAEANETMTIVRDRLRRIEAYIYKHKNEQRSELKDLEDRTVLCPRCERQTLVLGSGVPGCWFSLTRWDDPQEAAEEYVWRVHGTHAALPPMYGPCPDVPRMCLRSPGRHRHRSRSREGTTTPHGLVEHDLRIGPHTTAVLPGGGVAARPQPQHADCRQTVAVRNPVD